MLCRLALRDQIEGGNKRIDLRFIDVCNVAVLEPRRKVVLSVRVEVGNRRMGHTFSVVQ
jgi:hypothetical protein